MKADYKPDSSIHRRRVLDLFKLHLLCVSRGSLSHPIRKYPHATYCADVAHPRSGLALCIIKCHQHALLHELRGSVHGPTAGLRGSVVNTRQPLPSASLRGTVDSVLNFCPRTKCAFSAKEHLFNGKDAWVRIPQVPHFLVNRYVKHYTVKVEQAFYNTES